MNIANLVSMGNYGAYVWTAYGITLLTFGMNVFVCLRERKHVRLMLQTN